MNQYESQYESISKDTDTVGMCSVSQGFGHESNDSIVAMDLVKLFTASQSLGREVKDLLVGATIGVRTITGGVFFWRVELYPANNLYRMTGKKQPMGIGRGIELWYKFVENVYETWPFTFKPCEMWTTSRSLKDEARKTLLRTHTTAVSALNLALVKKFLKWNIQEFMIMFGLLQIRY